MRTYRCAYNPRITSQGEARSWGAGVLVQPGVDRQEARREAPSDTTDTPTPNVALRQSKAHMRCQVLVVSLGTGTLSQVFGSEASVQMRREFHRLGRQLAPGLARNVVSEALGERLPDSVIVNTIDCRRLHGLTAREKSHVGLNAGVQAKFMADTDVMGEIATQITESGLFPLQFTDAQRQLQRVVVAYCGSGEHRSPAIAVLMAAVFRKKFTAEVSSLIHPLLTVSNNFKASGKMPPTRGPDPDPDPSPRGEGGEA